MIKLSSIKNLAIGFTSGSISAILYKKFILKESDVTDYQYVASKIQRIKEQNHLNKQSIENLSKKISQCNDSFYIKKQYHNNSHIEVEDNNCIQDTSVIGDIKE